MALKLVFPDLLPYALMGVMVVFILQNVFMITIAFPAKKVAFCKEFMDQFEEEHRSFYGPESKVDPIGLPDQGNGWYARKLEYKQWVLMNNGMRIVFNMVESYPFYVPCVVLASLYFPMPALVCAWLVALGRIFYAIGYKQQAGKRILGGMIQGLSGMTLIILAVTSCVMMLS